MPAKKKPAKKQKELKEAKAVGEQEHELAEDKTWADDDSMMLPMDGEAVAQQDDIEESELDPEEQKEKDEKAEDKALFSGNEVLVEAVFDWLDAEIEATDSVKATLSFAKAYEIDDKLALAGMDFVRSIFEAKRTSFQNIRDTINKT